MNFYPFHIGDFRSGSVNMSRHMRWIYRDMLDVYYDSEQPLPLDMELLCHSIGVDAVEERLIVDRLLRFKFTKTDAGYRQTTCDRVIAEYRKKVKTARDNGKLGGRPRSSEQNTDKPTGFALGSNPVAIGKQQRTGSETNQEPRTKNHKPVQEQKADPATKAAPKYSALDALIAHGVDLQTASDWLAVRKAKNLPATKTALDGVVRELTKAGMTIPSGIQLCCERGWAGFNPSWLEQASTKAGATAPWWSSDALIQAKGAEMGMTPHSGEYMPAFKGRVQAAIDNGGKQPALRPGPVLVVRDEGPRGIKPDGLNLRSLITPGTR